MSTIYSQEIYNEIVANKSFNEALIDEIYGSYDSMTFDDKLIAIEIIADLKLLNDEYNKYIIVYQQNVKTNKSKSQYIVIEGDTLQKIAYKYTGSIDNWQKIYLYNGLKDIKLTAGDIINIPEDL
jgi:LysM repeat protein